MSGFASFTAAHGFAVNLFAVVALAAIGAGLLTAGGGRPGLLRLTIILLIALCLADWVLIEDFGFFGGLGTDPNSMIPMALVGGGRLSGADPRPRPGRRSPPRAAEPGAHGPAAASGSRCRDGGPPRPATERRGWLRPARWRGRSARRAPGRSWPPGRWRSSRSARRRWRWRRPARNADPIIAQAIDGNAAPLDFTAPAFTLTDQDGRPVSLAGLRGKVVLLTFLDPVCTSDCPLIAQEFRQADQMLGASRARRRAGRDRRQPAVPLGRVHPGLRPPGTPHRAAELALPDRHPGPAAAGVEELRDRGAGPARRRDDRATTTWPT